jgi:hypothetical protein
MRQRRLSLLRAARCGPCTRRRPFAPCGRSSSSGSHSPCASWDSGGDRQLRVLHRPRRLPNGAIEASAEAGCEQSRPQYLWPTGRGWTLRFRSSRSSSPSRSFQSSPGGGRHAATAPFLVRAVAASNPAGYPHTSAMGGLPREGPGAKGAHRSGFAGVLLAPRSAMHGGVPNEKAWINGQPCTLRLWPPTLATAQMCFHSERSRCPRPSRTHCCPSSEQHCRV